jgi:hypothetical protein
MRGVYIDSGKQIVAYVEPLESLSHDIDHTSSFFNHRVIGGFPDPYDQLSFQSGVRQFAPTRDNKRRFRNVTRCDIREGMEHGFMRRILHWCHVGSSDRVLPVHEHIPFF